MKRSVILAVAALTVGGFLANSPSATAAPSPAAPAPDQTLAAHAAALRTSADDAYTVYSTRRESSGATHTRYTRTTAA